jgi:DNA repair protein RadC
VAADPESVGASQFPGDGPAHRSADDLPRALRPEARLAARGARALSAVELVDLALGQRGSGADRRRLACRLVRRHGVAGLARLSPGAWRAEAGVGRATAARLCATIEIGRRAHGRDEDDPRRRVASPRDAWTVVRDIGRARTEHLVGLYLDAQNGLLARETISIGSLNTTRTPPREALYPAVTHLALGFILAHNHPSGCLDPSPEDVDFTQSIRRAGEIMGIELYDHLIVTRHGYTSLRERGLL